MNKLPMKEKLKQGIIKLKSLNVGTVNMWINLIGFIFSMVFYINYHSQKPTPVQIPNYTDSHQYNDSVRKINWQLHDRIKTLQNKQDSLMQQLKQTKKSYKQVSQKVKTVRSQLLTTINEDWEKLSKGEQRAYVANFIRNN